MKNIYYIRPHFWWLILSIFTLIYSFFSLHTLSFCSILIVLCFILVLSHHFFLLLLYLISCLLIFSRTHLILYFFLFSNSFLFLSLPFSCCSQISYYWHAFLILYLLFTSLPSTSHALAFYSHLVPTSPITYDRFIYHKRGQHTSSSTGNNHPDIIPTS